MSPALAGGFFTAELPGRPPNPFREEEIKARSLHAGLGSATTGLLQT